MRSMIQVKGLREFQASLRKIDTDLPKQLRVVNNGAAALVIDWAAPKVPRRSGRAARSLKARSGQRDAVIAAGGRQAPHYPWLDFGGRVGPAASVKRPFLTEGRYIYPGVRAQREEITDLMSRGLTQLATDAGLDVT